jgi:hypothetical protein
MNFWPHIGFHPAACRKRAWQTGCGEQHGQPVVENSMAKKAKKSTRKVLRKDQARDEEAQIRHAEERSVRQEGQEPEASNRDWTFRGAQERRQGSEEKEKILAIRQWRIRRGTSQHPLFKFV